MITASPVEALRARFRWHRGYRAGADERAEEYAPRLTPQRMSLLLGTLPDAEDKSLATLWVQRPPLHQHSGRLDAGGRPVFAVLLREGRWWRQLGLFPSVSAALEALSQTGVG